MKHLSCEGIVRGGGCCCRLGEYGTDEGNRLSCSVPYKLLEMKSMYCIITIDGQCLVLSYCTTVYKMPRKLPPGGGGGYYLRGSEAANLV